MLYTTENHKASPDSKGVKLDSTLRWEMLQSHTIKMIVQGGKYCSYFCKQSTKTPSGDLDSVWMMIPGLIPGLLKKQHPFELSSNHLLGLKNYQWPNIDHLQNLLKSVEALSLEVTGTISMGYICGTIEDFEMSWEIGRVKSK